MKKAFALKGDIVYSTANKHLITHKNSYLVCEDGKVAGIFSTLPEKFGGITVEDKTGQLIIPGLVDLHLHAPQYAFRGLGMDLELLEWLNTHTFPEEEKYADLDYAERAYRYFVTDLTNGGTTRASIFATAHVPATLLLMDILEDTGLKTLVGKVNMDTNASPGLQEKSAEKSFADTKNWLAKSKKYSNTKPILTPRFIPNCTDALWRMLAGLQQETGLPMQSHLSENPSEVALVRELHPDVKTYAEAYLKYNMLGGSVPTIMAHCVYSLGREMDVLEKQGVYIAHSPISNSCLSSGVAPVRAFMDRNMHVGLGTDIAGGFDISIFGVMAEAIKDSKLRWRLLDNSLSPLSVAEAFYLGTRGGGSFFGKVGAFENGWEFDALVLNDDALPCPFELTPQQRLERVIYLGGDENVAQKYVAGYRIK